MATQPGLLIPVELSATTAWTRLLGVSDNDIATALTTGSDGAIYASVNTISASDPISALINGSVVSAFITKYNADGTQVWTKQLGTTDNKVATSLSTGSDGSIYISGSTIDILGLLTNSSVINAFVTKYNADGTEIWTKQLETTDNKIATALSTGSDGSIYISGNIASGSAIDILSGLINSSSSNTTIITDVFVTKYNADGSQVWTKLLETSDNDVARSITTGSDGAIYVSGNTRGNLDGQTNNGGDDAFITKYNADGTKVWTKLLGTGGDDVARSLTIGSDGAIYVSGNTKGDLDGQTNNGGDDAFITKLFTTLNNPPTDLSLDTTTIDEGQTTVGNLTTTDPDTGNTFTYSLVTGDGATDNSLFTITNNQLKTNSVFDFETKNSY
ncbi:MAG: SBBP repeat-containing protein, partial [Dolichospermum sp.]